MAIIFNTAKILSGEIMFIRKKYFKKVCLLFAFILISSFALHACASNDFSESSFKNDSYLRPQKPSSIINDDDRVTVNDSTSYPYSAIALLTIDFSCGCSAVENGFMISKNCMLTAGHNLICTDHGNDAISVTATFGYRSGSNYLARITATPSNSVICHNSDFTGTQKDCDYSYVVFNSDIGNITGWFGIASLGNASLEKMRVNVSGYENSILKQSTGNVTSTTSFCIRYDADTGENQSGSPVYYIDSDNNYWVIAIHTHGTDWLDLNNSGWRMTSAFIDELYALGYIS